MDIPWQADLCVMMCWRVGQQRPKSDQIDSGTTQKNYPENKCHTNTNCRFLRYNTKAIRGEIATYISNIIEDGVKYHLKALQNKGIIKRVTRKSSILPNLSQKTNIVHTYTVVRIL